MRATDLLMIVACWAVILPLVWGLLAASDRWLRGQPIRRLYLYHFRLVQSDRSGASTAGGTEPRARAVLLFHPGKKKRAKRTA